MSSPKAPPPVALRPVPDQDFGGWRARTAEEYALGIGPARNLDPVKALEVAYEEIDTLLPDRTATENQLLWQAYDGDEPVGLLWIGTQSPIPCIYMIGVSEEQRGKGYGRSIMLAGEAECRRRGYEFLDLNVFGDNSTAIALYDSLGYVVTAQQMRKPL
jgi:ribosomal protein S18 acetylase RimI-like enzyme